VGDGSFSAPQKPSPKEHFLILLGITCSCSYSLEEGKKDNDPSMPKPQTFGAHCPCSSPLPCPPKRQGFCRLPFVFQAGSGFSQLSSWEHDSILYIKTKIQLKLRISEQSRELTTPHYHGEDAIEQGNFCKQLLLTVAPNVEEFLLVPLQLLKSGASQRDGDLQQNMLFSSVAWSSIFQSLP
jgi:hypothetical protein